MIATAELRVVPFDSDVSDKIEDNRVIDMLKGHDYIIEANDYVTQVKGELDDILDSIEEIHDVLLKDGKSHLVSYLKF
jgi:uncharacterized protein YqgV (UPF0045/DUF77 family)